MDNTMTTFEVSMTRAQAWALVDLIRMLDRRDVEQRTIGEPQLEDALGALDALGGALVGDGFATR